MELSKRQTALIAAATTALAAAAVVGATGLEWDVAPSGVAVEAHAVVQPVGGIAVPDHMALSVTDHMSL
ncbi:hypothetical protein [Kitasatospora sp. NPDC004531]